MNIYRIIEDGSGFCIQAKNMTDACNIAEGNYINDCLAVAEGAHINVEDERRYYQENIIESCSLIGPLRN